MYGQTFQTGPPFTVGFAGSPNLYLPGANRPTQIAPNDQVKLAHVDIGPNRFPFSAQKRYLEYQRFPLPGIVSRLEHSAATRWRRRDIVWGQASLRRNGRSTSGCGSTCAST